MTDTGIGISGRAAAGDLRGLPPGGRHDQPQVRRHRPWALDLARAGAPAGRRDRSSKASQGKGSTFTVTIPESLRPGAACAARHARRRRCRRPRRVAAAGAAPAAPAQAARKVDDDRERLTDTQPRPPGGRGRRALRRDPARSGARAGLPVPGRRHGRGGAGAGQAVSCRAPSCWMSACPTSPGLSVLDRLKRDVAHAAHPGPCRLGERLCRRRRCRWARSATC